MIRSNKKLPSQRKTLRREHCFCTRGTTQIAAHWSATFRIYQSLCTDVAFTERPYRHLPPSNPRLRSHRTLAPLPAGLPPPAGSLKGQAAVPLPHSLCKFCSIIQGALWEVKKKMRDSSDGSLKQANARPGAEEEGRLLWATEGGTPEKVVQIAANLRTRKTHFEHTRIKIRIFMEICVFLLTYSE